METKSRFNIERLAFMATVVLILAIVLYCTVDDKDLVLQISLGACFFIPAAYFTVNYFSGESNTGGIFYENEKNLSKDVIGLFSWSKYFMEFIVFIYVIGFLLVAGLIMFVFRWASNYGTSGASGDEAVAVKDTIKEIVVNPIFERSENILAKMINSESYFTHDSTLLYNFILIIAIASFFAFFCTLILFLLRKKNFRIAKFIRKISYWLTTLSFLTALFFLIFHNSFFDSDNFRKQMENENSSPGIVSPGQSIEVTLPNTSHVTSINRNYKDVSINISKSIAHLNNGSNIPFQSIDIKPINKWKEMKTDDHESWIFPEFEITIPQDSILYGSIIDMNVSLSLIVAYFYKGNKYTYDEKQVSINENLVFRIANLSEIKFYNSSKKFTTLIWFTNLGSFIFFILTLILGGYSVNKPIKDMAVKIPEQPLNDTEPNPIESKIKNTELTQTNKIEEDVHGDDEKDTEKEYCPNGCGVLKLWDGKLRCWKCGWPEK